MARVCARPGFANHFFLFNNIVLGMFVLSWHED
jgi:hypothetical protein